jgi:hypothetical protein
MGVAAGLMQGQTEVFVDHDYNSQISLAPQ